MAKRKTSAAKKARYSTYRSENRQDKNKAYKLAKHLRYQPEDKLAMRALKKLPDVFIKEANKRLDHNKDLRDMKKLLLETDLVELENEYTG